MDMQDLVVRESPRRRIARRVGAAGMALAALLVLGACRADGGGYVGEPYPGGPVGIYDGDAFFGFNFTCHMDKRADRAVIRGQITYHDSGPSTVGTVDYPAIRLHGIVDPFFVEDVSTCEQAAEFFPDAAQFEGTYRPQGPTPGIPGSERDGRFIVQVFDQGEPGTSREVITGDGFAIELIGGAYAAYTRGGYIEGGNVQVRGSK
jgi:hypothetical protein